MKQIKIFGLSKLGYGFPMDSFERGMGEHPDVLASDGGTTDLGPIYLATGNLTQLPTVAVLRDFRIALKAARKEGIPYIVGSIGIAGADIQLEFFLEKFKAIAREEDLHFRLAVISAEIDKDYLKQRVKEDADRIEDLTHRGRLTIEDINGSSRVVAQMGHQPIVKALEDGAEVVVCGRSCDNALFAAYPIMEGYDPGLALHAGKILECGAIAAQPGSSSDLMMGYLRKGHFLIAPTNPQRKATTRSIAEHSLYEQRDPYHIYQPGGYIDMTETEYEQYDDRTVIVSGDRWVPTECKVKLEGARVTGYRSYIVGSMRDPFAIENLDYLMKQSIERTKDNFSNIPEEDYQLLFHVYGRDGTMGQLEPKKDAKPQEVCLIIEAVGKTQEIAHTICGFAKSVILHGGFPGRKTTAGNYAVPYSPDIVDAGETAEFAIYHLLPVDDPCELFPIKYEDI